MMIRSIQSYGYDGYIKHAKRCFEPFGGFLSCVIKENPASPLVGSTKNVVLLKLSLPSRLLIMDRHSTRNDP